MIVRILKYWHDPDLMRQTPCGTGLWDDIQFTTGPVANPDVVLALTRVPETVHVACPPGNLWCLVQEPPVPEYDWLRRGFDPFDRVLTQDNSLTGSRFIHAQPALPWWVGRSYDDFQHETAPQKQDGLVWVTSNSRNLKGHCQRMDFLESVRGKLDIKLFGRGFSFVKDKWEVLAPARYALAIENHRGPWYWSEKLADCFLSWTLPIYWGCTNITDYFPPESMIIIDITKPDEAVMIIQEAMSGNEWERRLDAIGEARRRVLEEHQFFPFMTRLLRAGGGGAQMARHPSKTREVILKEMPHGGRPPVVAQWASSIRRLARKASARIASRYK